MTPEEKKTLENWAVILSERMRQTRPGEWEVVRVKATELGAKRVAHWINNNFGCATRVVTERAPGYEVQCQKSKKQPFAK